VQGYDPAFAQKMAGAMVQRSEQFVNEVGQSLGREQVRFVDAEVAKAHTALLKAANELIAYQNEHELLSPEIESESVSAVIGGLQQELARQKTELKALQSYLSAAAPEVSAARKRVSALERQIDQERSKQVRGSGQDSSALNDLLIKYKELELSLQVATDIYQTGLKSLEAAKLDASRKVKHLVMVSAPTLPQESTQPRRAYLIATWALLLHILYLVGGIVVTIIKDHRE
jgi:capsular polysaccharide transport system permease protein